MARRQLTDEEIKALAEKEWKQTPIFTSDEKFAYKAKNLKGPKTPEGKARVLRNLQVGRNKGEMPTLSHGGYVQKILNEDEQQLYQARKEVWLKDFVDFNESSDGLILHQILMDEVIYYRLMKRWADHPSEYDRLERPINECTGRLNRNIDALGALRKQRLKQDDKMHSISITTITHQFSKELSSGSLKAQLEIQAEEEKKFLADKNIRDNKNMIDADYEVVEEDDEDEPTT